MNFNLEMWGSSIKFDSFYTRLFLFLLKVVTRVHICTGAYMVIRIIIFSPISAQRFNNGK